MPKKVLRGLVVKAGKREKTITVLVNSTVMHSKYHKSIRRSKKYNVHDEYNKCSEGQYVSFIESKPISKTKSWIVQIEE